MSFNSLARLLEAIEKQPGWETYSQYRRLLGCWSEVVGEKVAPQTRPLYIARQVLWVATSSSVLAQELSLQRYSLQKKLNAHLPQPLADIRFSSAKWHSQTTTRASAFSNSSSSDEQEHPSQLETAADLSSLNLTEESDPQAAFQRWAEIIRRRSRALPPCPQCQAPTPPGELQRWQVCACCAAKQWAQSDRDDG